MDAADIHNRFKHHAPDEKKAKQHADLLHRVTGLPPIVWGLIANAQTSGRALTASWKATEARLSPKLMAKRQPKKIESLPPTLPEDIRKGDRRLIEAGGADEAVAYYLRHTALVLTDLLNLSMHQHSEHGDHAHDDHQEEPVAE